MDAFEELKNAFCANDTGAVRSALAHHPELKARINDPIGPFDSPAICNVRSREMLDVLLEAGADINAKSKWWAGGFCLLDGADDDLARYAIQRGARLEANAAARLGMVDRLKELAAQNPKIVNAAGGDGQRPLHVARNVEVARFLVEHGAEIDAKDIDHESTPAQYAIGERQDVARYLSGRGCKTDIFMAAALGDVALAKKHLDANPDCVRMRINNESFPMRDHRAGGTIYFWTLGRDVSPHQVARKFNREEILKLLMEASPPEVQLVNWCWLGEEARVKRIVAENPEIAARISKADLRGVADAAREKNFDALRLMLDAGLPIDARGQHQATALHWAAWHGDARAVQELLRRQAPLELTDADFQGTPLRWAMHGSENSWFCREGDYVVVVKGLLRAGAKIHGEISGTQPVQDAISAAKR